jgi:hypothetical protein
VNAVTERMQRARQYLERAARLEGTGQPVLCQTYVRRAGELIEETRTVVAAHRGSRFKSQLAMERAAGLIEVWLAPQFGAFQDAVARATESMEKNARRIRAMNEWFERPLPLRGPS